MLIITCVQLGEFLRFCPFFSMYIIYSFFLVICENQTYGTWLLATSKLD
jgi:hypothetical protein